jgi:hypothetical protein
MQYFVGMTTLAALELGDGRSMQAYDTTISYDT